MNCINTKQLEELFESTIMEMLLERGVPAPDDVNAVVEWQRAHTSASNAKVTPHLDETDCDDVYQDVISDHANKLIEDLDMGTWFKSWIKEQVIINAVECEIQSGLLDKSLDTYKAHGNHYFDDGPFPQGCYMKIRDRSLPGAEASDFEMVFVNPEDEMSIVHHKNIRSVAEVDELLTRFCAGNGTYITHTTTGSDEETS